MTTDAPTVGVVAADVRARVQISGSLAEAVRDHGIEHEIADAVQARLAEVAATLGIPTTVTADLAASADATTPAGDASGAVGESGQIDGSATGGLVLHVDGVRCRYPVELPRLARFALEGRLPDEPRLASPDPWLTEIGPPEDLVGVVATVCAEAVKLRPSVLLSDAASDAYLAAAAGDIGPPGSLQGGRSWVGGTLGAVLEQGLSIADTARVGALLHSADGTSVHQASELMIAELSRHTAGILLDDEAARALGTGDFADPDDLLAQAAVGLFEGTGVVFPRVSVEPPTGIPPGTFAIRVNDLVTLPTPLPPDDLVMVNDTAERIRLVVDSAQPAINPATDQPGAMVAATAREILDLAGYTTWDRAGYVILHLAACLRRRVGSIITQDLVLAQLEALEPGWPAVVRAARARLQPAELTGLIRALGRDGIAIRPLPVVLERIADLPAARLSSDKYAVVADPVQSPIRKPPTTPPDYDIDESFVRTGLGGYIADVAGASTGCVVVYLLSPAIETLLVDPTRSEADEDQILSAIAAELAELPPTARTPSLLTTRYARATLSRLLRTTFPRLRVLAHDDLPARVAVQPIARIALEE
jgi:hypothetical protein